MGGEDGCLGNNEKETLKTEVIGAANSAEKGTVDEAHSLLDLAFMKVSNLFQRSCSKVLRQELQCRGLSGGKGQSK